MRGAASGLGGMTLEVITKSAPTLRDARGYVGDEGAVDDVVRVALPRLVRAVGELARGVGGRGAGGWPSPVTETSTGG